MFSGTDKHVIQLSLTVINTLFSKKYVYQGRKTLKITSIRVAKHGKVRLSGSQNTEKCRSIMIFVKNNVAATWFPRKMMSRQHDFHEKWCQGNMISVKNDVKASWFLWKMMSQQHDFLQFLLDKPFSHNPFLLIKTLSKSVLTVYTCIEHIIAVNTMYWTCFKKRYLQATSVVSSILLEWHLFSWE